MTLHRFCAVFRSPPVLALMAVSAGLAFVGCEDDGNQKTCEPGYIRTLNCGVPGQSGTYT